MEPATTVVTEELFEALPNPGETVEVDLGSGLHARVPIALYSRDGHTIGDKTQPSLPVRMPPEPNRTTRYDPIARVADTIVIWNAFEHFWPYWQDVSVDWNAALDSAIAETLSSRSVDEHLVALRHLTVLSADAHISIRCPGEAEVAFAPFAVEWIEGQVVVTVSKDRAIKRGDVLLSIDNVDVAQLISEKRSIISGSPQWRAANAVRQITRGTVGSTMVVRVARDSSEVEVTLTRNEQETVEVVAHPAIERFDDGLYYVDLERAEMKEIDAVMDRLATAPGVVFDLRGRPNSNHAVLSHLLTRPDVANTWLAVPLIIRPSSSAVPIKWDASGWNLPVVQPHIQGHVGFLTGPLTVSYAESVMELVEYYHLGDIFGVATAGTNGDIAKISAPTGCTAIFTGRRVTKLDGSRFHLKGVQPTVPLSRTIAGVVAGRDELLEAALGTMRNVK